MDTEPIELTMRNEGCRALLHDEGGIDRIVPVCMGGTALIGCNDQAACRDLFLSRVDTQSRAYVIDVEEDVVCQVTSVRRLPAR